MAYRYEDFFREADNSASLSFAALDNEKMPTATEVDDLLNDPLFHTPVDVGDPGANDGAYPEEYDGLGDPDDKFEYPEEMEGTDAQMARQDAKDGFRPPAAVRKAAALGLELRREFGRGGTEVGVARARDLKNGKAVSRQTIGRMVNYFSRHTSDKRHKDWGNRKDPSPGWVAWLLWGGDPGERWCNAIWKKINPKAALDTQGEEEENVSREHTVNKGLPKGRESTAWDDTSRPVQEPAPDPHFTRQISGGGCCGAENCGCGCSDCPNCDCPDCGCKSEKSFEDSKGISESTENFAQDMSTDSEMAVAVNQIASDITHALICNIYGSPVLAYYELHDVARGAWSSDSAFLQNAAKWTREYINGLPDAAFAYIEPAYKNGETADKNARHLPHHTGSPHTDKTIDMAHLKNALSRVEQVKPVTNSVSKDEMVTKARAHLADHAKSLGVGDQKEETAMASTTPPKGKSVPKSQGLLDEYTFPRTAPASEGDKFHAPDGVKVPGNTSNETYKEQDDTVITKEHNHHEFSPEPGIKTPGNSAPTPTIKEQEDSTFPGHAGPGSGQKFSPQQSSSEDMNRKVEPGPQSPETERHQPYLHKEQDADMQMSAKPADKKKAKAFPPKAKKAAPKPPWDKKKDKKQKASFEAGTGLEKLPGMDYMKTASEEQKQDEHVESIEKCALEADLYARRFAKHAAIKDLHAQSDRFRSCRAGMEAMETCEEHDEEEKAYVKDVFAYSYGQMQRSIKRAMRNFAEEAEEPNMEAYHALLAMKADLLGEESSRHFANATFSFQMASWMAGDETMAEECEPEEEAAGGDEYAKFPPSDEECAEEMAEEMAEEPAPEQCEGEEDMKEADVSAAINIASQLQEAGLINGVEAFSKTVVSLAKMTQSDRQNWVAMAQNLSGQPFASAPAPVKTPMGTTYNRASADTVESNLVAVGSKTTVGGKPQQQQANRMLGLFMAGAKAPLFKNE